MVQLSVNVDGQKGDQTAKKPPASVEVPIPAKLDSAVAVKRGRCCTKTVVCVTAMTVVILLVVGATLLGVYVSRNKSWEDCFNWDDSPDSGSHSGGGSHGPHHGGGHHGGGSHGHHGGNSTHGRPGHGGGHHGRPLPHDGDYGGHGGEEHDGDGHRYPGNEGDHFPNGRP